MGILRSLLDRPLAEALMGGARRRENTEFCQVTIGLMQDLQLHRGLSGAVLDGQSGFVPELVAIEQKLSRSLVALAEHFGDTHPVLRHAQWQAVISNWQSVHDNWRELDFYTNLFVHSEVIKGLIGVMQTMTRDVRGQRRARQGDLVQRWPMLIEQLGILRALGLHWLGQAQTARDLRVRHAMLDYLGYADSELQRIDPMAIGAEIHTQTDGLLSQLAGLLDDDSPRLGPQDYYREMTGVIDAWYRALLLEVSTGH